MIETRTAIGYVRSALSLILALAICFAAARLGSLATTPHLPWYHALEKPFFTPPDWAFPVAWTTLYTLMGFALWRVVSKPLDKRSRTFATGVFFVQLALNITWSFAFFGEENPAFGLAVISALLVAIVANIMVFRPIDRLASLLLLPYLGWVAFAALLNLSIWWMNT
jgi:tryptophan-rich sensory protein